MPATALQHFDEDIARARPILAHADPLPHTTAAEYVYLLDPWWNPAVEAQAIDRSHRIGQTQRVFAYRLVCRDTVEEKILELQQKKRDLADAILNADKSLIQTLSREDLEFLLT